MVPVDRSGTYWPRWVRGLLLSVLFSVLLPATVHPDMGRITTSGVDVREDFQRAIIIHNLQEEILILATDIRADEKTTVLRFIPFPSEPQVSLAAGDPFLRVVELAGKHGLVFIEKTRGGLSSAAPVEVLSHTRLGVHDMTVVKINEVADFDKWVRTFLGARGLSPGSDYDAVEKVAADYVKRGIEYFVFDLVDVMPRTHSVEPVAYRFKSRKLYYPLRTSNTFGAEGGVDLFIIAPGTLCDPFHGEALYVSEKELYSLYPCMGVLGRDAYALRTSTSARLSGAEVRTLHAPATELFGDGEAVFMQVVRYRGAYDFVDDVLIDVSGAPREAITEEEAVDGTSGLRRRFTDDTGDLLELDLKIVPMPGGPTDRRCSLSPEPGPCEALFWRYYFDQEMGRCEQFIWGGCEGIVPFESKKECEEVCGARPGVEPADNPKEEGTTR